MSYSLIQSQRSMALDSRRNAAYAAAMAKVITPDSVVLDLGAGMGVHGLLAAQLGAKRVYLVEPENVIGVAAELAKANGYGDRIHCLQGKIEEVELPEAVDVIISVFTGNFLLEEDLLPSLFYARDHYLKAGGVMIPDAAVMEAVPVAAPDLYQDLIETWSQSHHGLDYAPARAYANQAVYFYCQKELARSQYLAVPAELMALDFYQAHNTHCNSSVSYRIKEAQLCHGWAGWFKIRLGETWLSTSPHDPPVHWSAAFLPLDPPLALAEGEQVSFQLQRPPHGDWSWRISTTQAHQQRSTFFSIPMTLKTMRKQTVDYQPQLSVQGEAALYVLENSQGTICVRELGDRLRHQFPTLFSDVQSAIRFIQELVERFG
jgi:SAM-dependent methyltransferase